MVSIPRYDAACSRVVTVCAKPKKALFTNCRTFADIPTSCSMISATCCIDVFGFLTVCKREVYVLEREGSSPTVPTTRRSSAVDNKSCKIHTRSIVACSSAPLHGLARKRCATGTARVDNPPSEYPDRTMRAVLG
jgi:hypothetical protein